MQIKEWRVNASMEDEFVFIGGCTSPVLPLLRSCRWKNKYFIHAYTECDPTKKKTVATDNGSIKEYRRILKGDEIGMRWERVEVKCSEFTSQHFKAFKHFFHDCSKVPAHLLKYTLVFIFVYCLSIFDIMNIMSLFIHANVVPNELAFQKSYIFGLETGQKHTGIAKCCLLFKTNFLMVKLWNIGIIMSVSQVWCQFLCVLKTTLVSFCSLLFYL